MIHMLKFKLEAVEQNSSSTIFFLNYPRFELRNAYDFQSN